MFEWRRGYLAAAVIFGSVATSHAAPVDLLSANSSLGIYLKSFPSGLSTDKVYLQSGTGTTVLGNVGSQSGLPVANFVSGTALDAANGFANIKADTAAYHDLTISVPGYSFANLLFNVQLLGLGKATDLTISAYDGVDLLGTLTLTHLTNPKVQKNSNTSFLVHAEGDATITSIVLQSTIGFKETKHFKLSGLELIPEVEQVCTIDCGGTGGFVIFSPEIVPFPLFAATVETPIPGAFLLMGTVLVGGGGFAAWRRRRSRS